MEWSPALPMATQLEGGVEGGKVGVAKCVGQGRVRRLFCIHELAH